MTLHNLGEMGFLGVKTDLFGHPLPFHPQFTHEKRAESKACTPIGEMGEMGEFTPAIVGEMGESPIGLTNSPTPTQAREADTELVVKQPSPEIVSNVIQSQVEQSDEALTFARQLRTRFADCRLTYHATDGRLRGRLPYWWAEVAR
ncbi:MAG: hypothetical protein IPO08_25025 [Xanthomonadales bacterium]|nr:hypothetical protein [Xanthomonadales bacterium]